MAMNTYAACRRCKRGYPQILIPASAVVKLCAPCLRYTAYWFDYSWRPGPRLAALFGSQERAILRTLT